MATMASTTPLNETISVYAVMLRRQVGVSSNVFDDSPAVTNHFTLKHKAPNSKPLASKRKYVAELAYSDQGDNYRKSWSKFSENAEV